MTAPIKVLLVSAPIGSGHTRAAQAIGMAIKEQNPNADIRIASIFDFFYPLLGQAILKIYLRILDIFPQAYGLAYSWGNTSSWALWGREIINRYLAGRMYRFIMNYTPNIIVCTHATPAGLVACLAKAGKLPVPSVAVITDFVVHRLWVYPEIGRYFVAHRALQDYLADQGIDYSRSQVVGIPVAGVFSVPLSRMKYLANWVYEPTSKLCW